MNIHELNSYNLADAVKFNSKLNPRIWQGEKMRPRVRETLLSIAEDFKQSLGLSDLEVKDITLSGSNAGFTYTPNSDIDLHLVVDIPQTDSSEVYRELFDAKKYQYNDEHSIKIGGYDVELYVQDANKPHHSQGVFSILTNDWVNIPKKQRSTVDDNAVNSKYELMGHKIESAIASNSFRQLAKTAARIKRMRQAGLDQHGELGPENLAYKMLRNQGLIEKLYAARTEARDRQLSLKEQPARSHVTYGYRGDLTTEDAGETWDGVSPTTQMFLNESDIDSVLARFFTNCIDFLEIENAPEMVLHHTTDWSVSTGSFGQFDPDNNVLHLATSGRHVLDILRTMAHELTHCKQNEQDRLPDNAGETGSWWEDEANAMAGRIMRHWAVEHPEMFRDVSLEESSGYIPTRAQAKDPRFIMALTGDVHPGQTGKEANKMALQTDSQGRPALLMKTANLQESLAAEFALFEQQDLFEIKMTGKNLKAEAAKTGAIAGMEFEMIVPNVEGGDEDAEPEPDWDYDRSVGGISDAVDFFDDSGQNSRRDLERLGDLMRESYAQWLTEFFDSRWEGDEVEFVFNYIRENASAEEIAEILGTEPNEEGEYPDPDKQAYRDAAEKVVQEGYDNYWYNETRENEQEDFNQTADLELDWLEDQEINTMQDVMNTFGMVDWPHWNTPSGDDRSIEDVANDFQDAIGLDVQASTNYHAGSVDRPSPSSQHYVVEPDGSLTGDDYGDRGLEFVSPPLPIDVIINDLNKVKRWAKSYGCYTNDSTGLHINISVPDYSRDKLDFVKLAILMGDEYVSDSFGRLGTFYAKSAMGMIRDNISSRPEAVDKALEKMRTHLDTAASKAIHAGVTQKYTSINVKDGHIEFRSPGGDWLGENFDKIENTLLRFTVAMSAALNPEMYREEYLKKLYKLLNPSGQKDAYGDMIQEFSKYMASLQGGGAEASGKLSKETQEAIKDFRTAASQELMQQNLANKRKMVNKQKMVNTGGQNPTYEIYNKQTGNAVETADGITNDAEALIRLNDYIEHGPHTLNRQQATAVFGIRTTSGVEIVDIDMPMAAARAARAATSPTGQWKMIDGLNREVYRFRPADNTRAKANELAALWARENNFDGNYQVDPVDKNDVVTQPPLIPLQQPTTVTESLDQPYKILRWEKGDYGDVDAIARLDDGTFLSIMFNKGFSQDTKEEAWSVEFYRNNSQEKTGEGDQQRVFATVLSAVQTFISDRVPGAIGKYKPNKIYFSASKEVKPDEDQRKVMTRARLYDSLVQRYARALGFRAFRADTGNKVMYELSRIKPVAENLEEGVNDNYLYHATMPAGMMRILRTGVIKAGARSQAATKAKTQYPTISTTRSKQYAESDDFVDFLNLTNDGNAVILVFDRNAVANHYKMFGTSQGTQTVGDEYEEVIVAPRGSMSIRGTLKGFYFNPNRTAEIQEYQDVPWFKELLASPYYMGKKLNEATGFIPVDSKDDQAVEELKAALEARKQKLQSVNDDQVYNIINKIMTRIANSHSMSGQKLHDMWVDKYKEIPDTWVMNENFADGKGPGRPGDSQRHGIPKGATMAELEKASHSKGRKGQLARWQLNMRRGKKK